jgi:hypothetical protein
MTTAAAAHIRPMMRIRRHFMTLTSLAPRHRDTARNPSVLGVPPGAVFSAAATAGRRGIRALLKGHYRTAALAIELVSR